MKLFKKHYVELASMFIVLLFMLSFMIIKKVEPFGNNSFVIGDCYSYLYPILCVLQNKLKTHDSLLYFWNGFLGDGYLPTYFFVVSSPLNFLCVFFEKSDLRSFINVTILLRIVFSAFTFGFYISRRSDTDSNKLYMIPLSCAYALSGFILGFFHESMWLDSYCILPIILYGYQRMVKDKKPHIYILSLVLSSLCNFFMTFMIGIFLVLWFFLDDFDSFKDFLKKSSTFVISSVLAIGMSAFSILITACSLLVTRVGDDSMISHSWFGNIFNIIKYHFFLSVPITVSYNNNSANIYCGTFTLILFFVYILASDISLSNKIKRCSLIIFLYVSMNESLLNYIWHGFHYQAGIPNRFSFIYIFIILITADDAIRHTQNIKKCCISFLIAEFFPLITYYFVDMSGFCEAKLQLIILMGLIVLYALLFAFYWYNNSSSNTSKNTLIFNIISIILMIFMSSEIIINASISLNSSIADSSYYDNVLEASERFQNENSLNQNQDNDMYRSIVTETTISNSEMLMDLRGVASFNGFINTKTLNFLQNIGYFSTQNSVEEKGVCKPIDDILGIKQIYTLDEAFISQMDYTKIYSDNDLAVYQNDNALSIGYAVNKPDNNFKFIENSYINNINSFASYITSGKNSKSNLLNEIYPQYSISGDGYNAEIGDVDFLYLNCTPTNTTDSPYIKINYLNESDGIYNISILYENYATIIIYVNDQIRRYEFTQSGGVLPLGHLSKGDQITIVIKNDDYSADGISIPTSQGLEIHISELNINAYNELHDKLSKNQMKLTALKANKLHGTISLDDNQTLFTSIPYDKGWHIYENGKELNTYPYANTFLGVDLTKGEHELDFIYIPNGFYIGILISVLSWILYLTRIFYKKKGHRK